MIRRFLATITWIAIFTACKNLHLPTEPQACATEPGSRGILHGSVVDDGGAPVSGVLVAVGAQTVTTDAAGIFNVELPSGSAPFRISGPDFTGNTSTIVIPAGSSTIRAVKVRGSSEQPALFGRVFEACSGRPIAGARISVSKAIEATSFADGTYVLACCWSTAWYLTVEKKGYKTIDIKYGKNVGSAAMDFLMEPN